MPFSIQRTFSVLLSTLCLVYSQNIDSQSWKSLQGPYCVSITAGCILWVLLFSIYPPLPLPLTLLSLAYFWCLGSIRDHGLVEGQEQMYANSQRIYNFIYVAYYNSIYYFIISLWGRWNRLCHFHSTEKERNIQSKVVFYLFFK